MNISELNDGVSGIKVKGEIGFVGKRKHIQGEKNGRKYDFYSQFVVLNDVKGTIFDPINNQTVELEEDSVGVNARSDTEITQEQKGIEVQLMSCKVSEYEKDGEKKKSLQTDKVIFPDKKVPEKTEQPKETTSAPSPQNGNGKVDWEAKDRRMAKENALTGACNVVSSFVNQGWFKTKEQASDYLLSLINGMVANTYDVLTDFKQVQRIHILKNENQVSGQKYEETLAEHGVVTSKHLTRGQADKVIENLNGGGVSHEQDEPPGKEDIISDGQIRAARAVKVEFAAYDGKTLGKFIDEGKYDKIRMWGSDKFNPGKDISGNVTQEACKLLVRAREQGLV